MANYCFISFLQLGHMDFGGQSFVRLAQELMKRGHRVTWVFSYSEVRDFSKRAHKVLSDAGIEYDGINRFYLTISHHHRNIMDSAGELEQLIRAKAYDCLVIDRLCVGAAFAAAGAGIPWVTVGTDGREWSFVRDDTEKLVPTPKPNDTDYFNLDSKSNFPDSVQLRARSYWATSSYLNLSFFPRSYYSDIGYADIPSQSHFLGAEPDTDLTSEGNTVLITFGNTFNESVKRKLVRCILGEFEKRNIPALVLTGNDQLTAQLQKEFVRFHRVAFKSWMPYDEAYGNALVAIGHGGTSHVWTGMRDAVPLFVIPSIGDQVYGGKQVERLNIGRTININSGSSSNFLLPEFIARIFSRREGIKSSDCIRAFNQLLDDPELKEACRTVRQQMRSGGGVHAGASLLEKLVHDKSPITRC